MKREARAGRSQQVGLWLLAALPLVVFLLFPILALILKAFHSETLQQLLSAETLRPLTLSFFTSFIALLLIVLFGTPVAFVLARGEFPGRRLLEVLVEWPTVLPPAVAGLALLLALGRKGLAGQYLHEWGVDIAFSTTAVILAQVFVAAPYFIKAAAASLSSVDRDLLDAAEMDGADSWQVFRCVLLPLSWRGFVGGMGLSWARALGEFGATILFAGNLPGVSQTMPLAVYLGFESDYRLAISLSVILLILSFGLLLGIRAILERGKEF